MNKNFKFYLSIWAILLALFNVISFVSPGWIWFDKYTPSFWIGYAFIMLFFIGQLVTAFIAFKTDNSQKLFYNISIIRISFTGLVLSFVFGGIIMLGSPLPYWIGALVCGLILAANAIAVIKAKTAADAVSVIDDRVKAKTYFIKALSIDAENLILAAKTDELKKIAKRVFEAVRFSDPMSNAVLVEIEEKIQSSFADFENAVDAEDSELATSTADDLIALIDTRNKKCKLLK